MQLMLQSTPWVRQGLHSSWTFIFGFPLTPDRCVLIKSLHQESPSQELLEGNPASESKPGSPSFSVQAKQHWELAPLTLTAQGCLHLLVFWFSVMSPSLCRPHYGENTSTFMQ